MIACPVILCRILAGVRVNIGVDAVLSVHPIESRCSPALVAHAWITEL
jgi:hypothetical protein